LLGTGGLTKIGAARLSLNGSNTFTGNIQVNEGDLTLTSRHEGSGSVTCADGTTLGLVSSGTNAVVRLSAATLGSSVGGILKCRFGGQDGHQATEPVGYVTNLTLNGTIQVDVTRFGLVVPGSIIPLVGYGTLSGTPAFVTGALTGTGDADWVVVNNTSAKQIQLVPAPTLSWQPVPGGLELQWPILGTFVQSNAVSVANPALWFDMAGTDSVTNLTIIPNPALTNVYYRLRLP
jgi:autotransporter-associated beta strand protein